MAQKHPASKKYQVRKPILDILREVFPSPPPTAVVSKPCKPECSVKVQKLPLRSPTIYHVAEDGTLTPKGRTSDRPVSMAHLQQCCQVVSTSVNKAMAPIVQQTVQEKEEKDLMISLLKDLKKSNDQLLSYLQKKDKNDTTTPPTTNPGGKKHKAEQ